MDEWKFNILDDFALKDENVELEFKSSCERMESTIRPV